MTRRSAIAVWAFVSVTAIVGLLVLNPLYGDICTQQENSEEKQCASYHIALVLGWQVVKALNDYSAAISAFATVAIAFFTWTLWRSNEKLWRAGEVQREEGRIAALRQAMHTRQSLQAAQSLSRAASQANEFNRRNAVADRRPWIAVIGEPRRRYIKITPTRVEIALEMDIQNVGKMPAHHVMLLGQAITTDQVDFARRAHDMRLARNAAQDLIGFTIFPNQKAENIWITFAADLVGLGISGTAQTTAPGLMGVGCWDYFYDGMEESGQTPMTYTIMQLGNAPFMIGGTADYTISEKGFFVLPTPMGAPK